MSDQRPSDRGRLDPGGRRGDDELVAAIGALGDRARPAPEWPELLVRAGRRGPRHPFDRWPGRRAWPMVAVAAVALMVIAGGVGWGLGRRGGDGTVEVDTVDRSTDGPDETAPARTVPTDGSTTTTPTPPAGDAIPPALELGPSRCVDGEPERFAAIELVAIQGDLDGDGRTDAAGAVGGGDGEILLWASLGDGTWVLTEATGGERPPIEPGSAWTADLDGDGTDEVVVQLAGATVDPVVVYRLGDCAFEAVPTGTGDPAVFAADAHGPACGDVCNVGLVCLPGDGLVATETEPVDPAVPRGDHEWARDRWAYRDGVLVEVSTERGTLPWAEVSEAGFANRVSCETSDPAPDLGEVDRYVLALAQALGVEVLVAESGSVAAPGERGLVVVDGEVRDLDPEGYRVVGLDGDALATAPDGSWVADGPRLDLDGRPIDCPALPEWSGGAVPGPMPGIPVRVDDGGWGVEIEVGVAAEPLDLPAGFDGPLWPIERELVDCATGRRSDRPPIAASATADGLPPGDRETFLQIVDAPGRTVYLGGGEGVLSIFTDDGGAIDVPGTTIAWAVTPDGTGLVRFDLDEGAIERLDIVSGERRWITPLDPVVESVGLFEIVGDWLVVSDPFQRATLAIDLETGDTAVEPLPHPGSTVTGAR